ncbi:ER membrane glycoprotein subunit of the GPI transamidase complex-like protein [Aspergillus melleus]|uniref:ER membrane glycoprotein subunit of the GPI transamidase complex-like protein n=1 Tax=Aspergillus melleus TaxID=138277 RepID=A0ACC3APR7_9EURO|nr:ER membrane glycoprotein subunit of the GPI transamidase complex-like protein [Aspergillus melleus]
MASKSVSARPGLLNPSRPVRSLSVAFWLWKTIVFLVVVGCPGPGYDTSTSLLPQQGVGSLGLSAPLKFVSYGFGKTIAFLSSVLNPWDSVLDGSAKIAIAGVTLSHLAHYLSVLALYRLSINVFGQETTTQRLVCFLSAALHVISPAGAFLSAPYGEPVFSFLNITGLYIYSSSVLDNEVGKSVLRNAKLLLAALVFSAATVVRSNGILSGFLFAYDALIQLQGLLSRGVSVDAFVHLGVVIISGCILALGFVVPQLFAYAQYCMPEDVSRPWCRRLIPSIYGWVQDNYWNVGFLRYWTVSNIPLFLLAFPMLAILIRSSTWGLKAFLASSSHEASDSDRVISSKTQASLLMRLTVPQALLSGLAITNYHVQIINRVSSGYPVWYWYLAHLILGDSGVKHSRIFTLAVPGAVIYALIQAVLFGSFLPPA